MPDPPLPSAQGFLAAAEHQGCIYACGGYRTPSFTSAALSMLDPRTRAWSSLPAMPAATFLSGAVLVGSRMYVPGGYTTPPEAASSSLQCYDMAAGRWDTSCAPMSVARCAHGVAALQGEVWALGGKIAPVGATLASVEVYSPRLNSWRAGEALPHCWEKGSCSVVHC